MSEDLTELDAAYEDNDSFMLLSVGVTWNQDTPERQRELAEENGWDWAKVFDPHRTVHSYYGVRSVPRIVLVDPEGDVRAIGGSRDIGEIRSILEEGLDSE